MQIGKQMMLDLIIEAKKADPETGSFSEWLAEYLVERLSALTQDDHFREVTNMPTLTPLTQADLDGMDYDKVWIDYEDGTGEWALVCNGYIYSIDTLEGAGFDFVDYMRGERLEPHGYKVYRRSPEGEEDT